MRRTPLAVALAAALAVSAAANAIGTPEENSPPAPESAAPYAAPDAEDTAVVPVAAGADSASDAGRRDVRPSANQRLEAVIVVGTVRPDPPYPSVLPSVRGGKISVGKKTTVVDLAEQPENVTGNFREVFARVSGILISEQQVPSFYNVNYRGLGDPHESEFVLFLKDGLPQVSDWLGYATLYAAPSTERIERIEFIRGGASLLYGPQPGPVVNFITRRASPEAGFAAFTDQVFGTDGLYSTYSEVRGGDGRFGWLGGLDFRKSDGFRQNGDYKLNQGDLSLVYQPSDESLWRFDAYSFDGNNGEAGRLTQAQWEADPDQTTAPFNRINLRRQGASIGHERALGDATALYAQGWVGYFDRFSRRTNTFVPGTPAPTFIQYDRQEFTFGGIDARIQHDWGSDHTLTAGTMLYAVDSPREQSRSANLNARGERGELPRFQQDRGGSYVALFAENLFRLGAWQVVPSARVEFVSMFIDETERLASLRRPAIDRDFDRTVPLLGLGAIRDLGAHQFYANASQGYRPMRYDDIGNPTAELAPTNDPKVAKAQNLEAGFRGAPFAGFFYDVSVFNVRLRDRVETRAVPGALDIERVNSGDSRHRGIEFSLEYDLLATRDDASDDRLTAFVNGSLLDAEITGSVSPALVGRTPQYAPDHLLRAGLIYKAENGTRVALTGTAVASQFWQDSNLPSGSGPTFISAEIPAYRVVDLSIEIPVLEQAQILAGMNNVTDRRFYSRVRIDGNNGIDPAPPRNAYVGFRYVF